MSVVNFKTIILLEVVVEERVLFSTQPVAHEIVRRLFVIKLYKPVIRIMIIVALAQYILKVHILGAMVFRILILKVVEQVASWLVVIMDVAVPLLVDEDILVVVEAAHTAILQKATILTLLTLCLFYMLVC